MKRLPALSALLLFFAASVYSQGLDISGWKLVQANSAGTYVIPNGTVIPPGGYVVIARNATQSGFETFWNKKLDLNCVYLNTLDVTGAAPKINGDETFTLLNAAGQAIDGPSAALPSSLSGRTAYQRKSSTLASGAIGSWTIATDGAPGTGMTSTGTGKVIISEIADATGTGNFVYEFVELFYDVAAPATGQGTATITPARFAYNQPASIAITVNAEGDTLRGLRCIKPSFVQWTAPTITVQAGTPVVALAGDTLSISNIAIAPSGIAQVTLPGITSADTTAEISFTVQTTTDGMTYAPIKSQPKTLVYGTPRPLSQVKQKTGAGASALLGKWVVVRGVVTAAQEFGGPSYLQDATGGAAVFDSSVTNNVQRGDDVVVLGLVAPYNELFELTPAILLSKMGTGVPVEPLPLTAAQIASQNGSEPYEGLLVRIDKIGSVTTTTGGAVTAWSVTGSGTNYHLNDATGAVQVRISPKVTSVANMPTPGGAFDMVGVLGQFGTAYQVMPRSSDDIILETGTPKILTAAPYESSIGKNEMTFSWKTDLPSSSLVRYGATSAYGGETGDSAKVFNHAVTVKGLWPGTVYHAQIVSQGFTAAAQSSDLIVSTASGSSSGQINVYFNKSVDPSVALSEKAQTVSMTKKIIARINAAKYSIDAALYSLSGAVGDSVASALIDARGRGVRIRFICETDNQNTAPINRLVSAGVYKINDAYDLLNVDDNQKPGAGLMHNKFFIFDNRDTTTDTDDWVWAGSWNATDPGTNDDMQDAFEIQDKALANAYTMEFNEMWGSAGDSPNQSASRFGARKTDNTPHLFTIGGTRIESYFSPSDRVTNHIVSTLSQASSSINLGLLTLTRSDIADVLVQKKKAGVSVHGVIDNKTDQGSQVMYLQGQGVDLLIDVNSGLLHHKYAIVDANVPSASNAVIAGSHNWSSAAETSNNENTLIMYGPRIANLYYQEFKARYRESGGKDNLIVLGVERASAETPSRFALEQNFPNPFNPSTVIGYRIASAGRVSLAIFDVLGREVASLVDGQMQPGAYSVVWNASAVPSGVYFCRLQSGSRIETRKLLLQK
ncbi:MAG: phospholipase D-like domain-containing protein [Acidobacteriota bacterium]